MFVRYKPNRNLIGDIFSAIKQVMILKAIVGIEINAEIKKFMPTTLSTTENNTTRYSPSRNIICSEYFEMSSKTLLSCVFSCAIAVNIRYAIATAMKNRTG